MQRDFSWYTWSYNRIDIIFNKKRLNVASSLPFQALYTSDPPRSNAYSKTKGFHPPALKSGCSRGP